MLYMHYPAPLLHFKDTGIARNVTEFGGVEIYYSHASLLTELLLEIKCFHF